MKQINFSPHHQILRDNRFRDLVGKNAWRALPDEVRKRFGYRLRNGASVVYQGKVASMRMNMVGRLIAQITRLLGGPLPYDTSCLNQPAVVTVTEDCLGKGQFWVRQYGRAAGFPQVIRSSKRFAGPTGIEEYIGAGIGMALRVSADRAGIYFKSDHFFLQLGRRKLRLPAWLQPGALTIAHIDLGQSRFLFSLKLQSRFLGNLIQQDAVFHDIQEGRYG
ncbi:DUF4166 domain-containing protein [Ruegeria arenilitoris]|uniref:DUF4166 domain-containing protein n=1 Tax=Ruegeria arenilitoris TaxID=1173585 RepID=UPI00147BCC96|nr:DUF4166 domain-containing protein [Ruegeria arenilitoris]